ncbi:type II restriction endonuclease [Domibacillus enclensis]|uniref:EcoRII C terminal n=1 Tax=Domibacillus enclensis TaxID=1017273 RepID=A0A1N7C575_9BACI|nr:type II restriction endonuclease [Domibacillus enclensis]OXS74242.1 restriction endonuclease [Domibacillus enclensis]SIR58623.1 EcoRII C terminal [Domibacillus enclensis]
MRQGFLSQYFKGVAVKRLRAVEVDPHSSNQHELNGASTLKNLLGEARINDKPARFMWLGGEDMIRSVDSAVTWYDAREQHPTRSEYRLYFRRNEVMDLAQADDLLIAAITPDDQLYMIVVPSGSTYESQLIWLFDFPEEVRPAAFTFNDVERESDRELTFAARFILEELGIEIHEPEESLFDSILEPYLLTGFPRTAEFSRIAREHAGSSSVLEAPDETLLGWIEFEERLFRRLERQLVSKRLEQGFMSGNDVDVDGFISFSLSVQNRRKSRVGLALENHLQEVFTIHGVDFSRGKVTENKAKPDFIFPNIERYRDDRFPVEHLTMLGSKSTCKDRWRQVLSEAKRLETKHLFTLEPGISENQTTEMQANKVQLVLPQKIHATYKAEQQGWLMNLEEFLNTVKKRAQ